MMLSPGGCRYSTERHSDMDVRISPSLMCCDLMRIGEEVRELEVLADEYHIDILDWHYCKNMSLAPCFIEGLRSITGKPLEAHLYVDNVACDLIELCIRSGASMVTVDPYVIGEQIGDAWRLCSENGVGFGLFLNPATPLSAVEPHVGIVDRLLMLTVEPGFPGQPFQEAVLGKIEAAAKLRDRLGLSFDIESDGCCNENWYRQLRDAGVDTFVLGGSGLFSKAPTTAEAIEVCRRELAQCLSM